MEDKKFSIPDYTLLWTEEELQAWYDREQNKVPEEPKIRRQKPNPPRDERNVKK